MTTIQSLNICVISLSFCLFVFARWLIRVSKRIRDYESFTHKVILGLYDERQMLDNRIKRLERILTNDNTNISS